MSVSVCIACMDAFTVNNHFSIGGREVPSEDPEDISNTFTITLEAVFAFATGSEHEPPLGFENTPEIHFEMRRERLLPHASTCGPTLYLPIALDDPDKFQKYMDYAIIGAHGFGTP